MVKQDARTVDQVRITRPIVIDLTDSHAPVVDEEYVVEWQISEPSRPATETAPREPSRA